MTVPTPPSRSPLRDRLLARLQALSETRLTNAVAIPLLSTLGRWRRVEYRHGADDLGKDVICWRTDELGQVELAVVQVKARSFNRKAEHADGIPMLVAQLLQATQTHLPAPDGTQHLPRTVYLVTSFPFTTQLKGAQPGGFDLLKAAGLKIVDGPMLADLLTTHMPDLAASIGGPQHNIDSLSAAALTNQALLSALRGGPGRHVSTVYAHVSGHVGEHLGDRLPRVTADHRAPLTAYVPLSDWEPFAAARASLRDAFDQFDVVIDGDDVEAALAHARTRVAALRAELQPVTARLSGAHENVRHHESQLDAQQLLLRASSPALTRKHDKRSALELRLGADALPARDRQLTAAALRRLDAQLNATYRRELRPYFDALADASAVVPGLTARVASLEGSIRSVAVRVALDRPSLTDRLIHLRSRLASTLDEMSRATDLGGYRGALSLIARQLAAAERVLAQPQLAEAAGLHVATSRAHDSTPVRRLLPVQSLLHAGMNVLLVGEAGSGKTTNLQFFAHQLLLTAQPDTFTLFVPLGRAISAWTQAHGSPVDVPLDQVLAHFVSTERQPYSREDFVELLRRSNAALILDGLDEATRLDPLVVSKLARFAGDHPQSQIVSSARTTTGHLSSLNFLVVQLEPFTHLELKQFIANWFFSAQDAQGELLRHLETFPELAAVAGSPLSATVLCVLHERAAPLPTSEARLHGERLRLLLGDFDFHKGVSRSDVDRRDLERAAAWLAFCLHVAGVLSEGPAQLVSWLRDLGYEATEANRVISQLADPCNVLLPMSMDGQLGFGHLSHQEFLAGLHLARDKALDARNFLYDPWWRAALVYCSHECPSVDWLLDDAGSATGSIPLVRQIVSVRPQREHARLREKYLS